MWRFYQRTWTFWLLSITGFESREVLSEIFRIETQFRCQSVACNNKHFDVTVATHLSMKRTQEPELNTTQKSQWWGWWARGATCTQRTLTKGERIASWYISRPTHQTAVNSAAFCHHKTRRAWTIHRWCPSRLQMCRQHPRRAHIRTRRQKTPFHEGIHKSPSRAGWVEVRVEALWCSSR